MPKYRKYFRQMIDENEQLFAEFKKLHDMYAEDEEAWQDDYNEQGKEVVEIIRLWEHKLCGNMERGKYAKYSQNLSEKFWDEVRAFFPMIDFVGVIYV